MTDARPNKGIARDEVLRFIFEHVDSVPHLEALLQFWNGRMRTWSAEELAARLYIEPGAAIAIIVDLSRRGFVFESESDSGRYSFASSPESDRMMEGIAEAYRTDLVRISTGIHSKASAGVREFARAFQFIGKRKKT